MGKLARMRERGVEIFKNQNFLIILSVPFSPKFRKSLYYLRWKKTYIVDNRREYLFP